MKISSFYTLFEINLKLKFIKQLIDFIYFLLFFKSGLLIGLIWLIKFYCFTQFLVEIP